MKSFNHTILFFSTLMFLSVGHSAYKLDLPGQQRVYTCFGCDAVRCFKATIDANADDISLEIGAPGVLLSKAEEYNELESRGQFIAGQLNKIEKKSDKEYVSVNGNIDSGEEGPEGDVEYSELNVSMFDKVTATQVNIAGDLDGVPSKVTPKIVNESYGFSAQVVTGKYAGKYIGACK